jgi:hypothetical protein
MQSNLARPEIIAEPNAARMAAGNDESWLPKTRTNAPSQIPSTLARPLQVGAQALVAARDDPGRERIRRWLTP